MVINRIACGSLHDATLRFVLAPQEIDLLGQIAIDGAGDAVVEKLGFCRAVGVAIEIGCIVGDLDIAVGRRPPFYEFHQGAGMAPERLAVVIDPLEHYRGDREYHFRRREFPLRQDMVDQAAVEPPVTVLLRVHIHEAEGRSRRMQYGVEIARAHAFIGRDQEPRYWVVS